jgi:hypothetical protein
MDVGIQTRSRSVNTFMTRSEIASAIHSVLQETDRSLTLIGIRALPFAWELRFEDPDGVERLITVHQGSVASLEEAIAQALDPGSIARC